MSQFKEVFRNWNEIVVACKDCGREYSITSTITLQNIEEMHKCEKQFSKNILKEAEEIIYGDRENTYGHPAKNLVTIAALWKQYLYAKYNVTLNIDYQDVCNLMVLMKIARLCNSPTHRDSKVDICGYMALQERCEEYVVSVKPDSGDSSSK